MRSMVLTQPRTPLVPREWSIVPPRPEQLVVKVLACAVCRTDLHVVDGELPRPSLPLVPGHEIVGTVVELGSAVTRFKIGDRVGVPWLGWTCGVCAQCRAGRENLCAAARFTGYTLDGGYAEYARADQRYAFAIPAAFGDVEAAPLLCAGLIGHRSLGFAGEAERLGIYGFGAAAHIVTQVARYQGRQVYAFVRPGDERGAKFAREIGATWVGDSTMAPPEKLDAALIFAPVGALVPAALNAIVPGGTVVCAGIHMSDIPSFPYAILWQERVLRSVANLTRHDAEAFLALAPRAGVRIRTRSFALEDANSALDALRSGQIDGAAVLVP